MQKLIERLMFVKAPTLSCVWVFLFVHVSAVCRARICTHAVVYARVYVHVCVCI